jgi:hypothetical protein
MDLQKLNVKVFVEQPNQIPLTEFIDVFHGWIQATDGEYHDVADYSHMQAGPGVVLIANDANVSIDEVENRRGLLFSQKGRLEGSNPQKVRQVLHAALASCRKLEEEPALRGKLRFVTNEVAISVNDRGVAANSEEEFLQLKAEVDPIARDIFGDAAIDYERDCDPRQRLNLRLKTTSRVALHQALTNSRPQ